MSPEPVYSVALEGVPGPSAVKLSGATYEAACRYASRLSELYPMLVCDRDGRVARYWKGSTK